MFDKREYLVYKGVKSRDIYPQVCRFWSEQGFYVGQLSPFEIQGQSYHQRIGIRREFYLRMNESEGDSYIDLSLRAKVTTEGLFGGAVAAVIFWPVALAGGAISYYEYEKDTVNLLGSFWDYVDNISGEVGTPVQAVPPFSPPAYSTDSVSCSKCSALLPRHWRACPYCGTPMD